MKEYILYKIVSPSGKVYIGQTSNLNLRIRMYKYKTCKSQKILYNSIKKYGWDKHIFTILKKLKTTLEIIDALEIKYIAQYKALNISLNIASGGRNGNKGNIRLKGKDNPNSIPVYQFDVNGVFIKMFDSMSEASKISGACISKISKAIITESFYAGGYLWLNKKLFDKGIKPNRSNSIFKPCIQLNKQKEFIKKYYCASEANRKTKINTSHILECLKGTRKSAGGFLWYHEKVYNNL